VLIAITSFVLSAAIPAAAITSLLWTVVTAVDRTG
jgi:hypothetical protein